MVDMNYDGEVLFDRSWRDELPDVGTCSPADWMLEATTAAVGLSAGGENAARYRELIAADEQRSNALDMSRMSGCGLVVRGYMRIYQGDMAPPLRTPALGAPYKPGSVLATIQSIGDGAGARILMNLAQPGDILFLQEPDHVCVITRVDVGELTPASMSEAMTIESVDGGQRDGRGAECILRRKRSITYGSSPTFGWAEVGTRRPLGAIYSWPAIAAWLRVKAST